MGELRKGTLTPEAAAEKDPARKRALMDANRGGDLVVRDIYLKGEGTRSAWTIEEARASPPPGVGRVAGRLDSASPFALDMKASAEGRVAERDYRADIAAKGSLKSLQVDLDATISGQRAIRRGRYGELHVMSSRRRRAVAGSCRVLLRNRCRLRRPGRQGRRSGGGPGPARRWKDSG